MSLMAEPAARGRRAAAAARMLLLDARSRGRTGGRASAFLPTPNLHRSNQDMPLHSAEREFGVAVTSRPSAGK